MKALAFQAAFQGYFVPVIPLHKVHGNHTKSVAKQTSFRPETACTASRLDIAAGGVNNTKAGMVEGSRVPVNE